MSRETLIKNSSVDAAATMKRLGINHNLKADDVKRFWGTIEAPVRISETRIFHDFSFGAFSYVSGGFLYHTHVGRYCSLSNGLHIGQGNHPVDWLSTHPFQYQNLKFHVGDQFIDRELYEEDVEATRPDLREGVPKPKSTHIGNDVWLGHGVVAMNDIRIGDGCVIGSSSVVTKNMEPYSIAVGNPARVIRKRFDDAVIERLLELKWWNFAPWQLRHIDFNKIDTAISQIEEMRGNRVPEYQPQVVTIAR